MTTNVQSNPRGETFFLNLRFLLIICVFVGNAIEPLIKDMAVMHTLYVWIFTFHMPLFVFVTGYFAKTNLLGQPGRKLMLQIGLQYVIFQSLYSVLDVTIFQVENIRHSFFAPYLLLWFLASHLCWRLLLMAMNKWTPLQQLALSLALGVLVGYLQVDGTWLSLSRTFVYLPFFIAGYHFSFAYLIKIFTPKRRLFTLALAAALLGTIALWGSRVDVGWLYGSMTYSQLGHYEWHAGLYRLALYALQLLAGIAFLSFVPLRESKLTDLGRRTLYVFLLHGLIIRIAAASPLYDYITNAAASIMLIIGAVLLTLLLSHSFVRKWTSPVIEPSVQWLLNLERRAFRPFSTASKQ
ncbi:acyltransferase family protein [Paenibacillus bouchesdurhonensis]|uniref:acyltransferase family protein n=1 Tax=Paenibacillus bouchesdurhonensis TaxID=1870990 RepID=UPI000DA5F441|nr:acyltransferase family protein [Paenibacillus bouchesdurhonensis]